MNRKLRSRRYKDRFFRATCFAMVLSAFCFMASFFVSIAIDAYQAFWVYTIDIAVQDKKPDKIEDAFSSLYKSSSLPEKDRVYVFGQIFSNRASEEFAEQITNGSHVEITLSSKIYGLLKNGEVSDPLIDSFIVKAKQAGLIKKHFSPLLLINKESRDPEFAGITTALLGSIISILIALVISIPLALFSAIYLEELVSKNSKIASFARTNIANLASVPSIVYGIVGYAIYIEYFDLPRSSGIVGGLTLMLMTVPNLIITYSTALRTVPGTIKNAAIALGLSKQQVIFHHVVPYCIPGLITGTMLMLARIFGETAPLLMIGMAAFVVDLPSSVLDPTTVLPMQIYLWADSPEYEFVIKSSGGIIVLLLILMIIGIIALKIKNKYTIKW